MARRRKSDTNTTVKPPVSVVAVRKSRRQIARKQSLEDKKVNGEISRIGNSQISPEESSNNQDDDLTGGKIKVGKKKLTKSRRSISRNEVENNIIEMNEESIVVPLKKNLIESDICEDTVENIVITKNIDQGDCETVDSNQVVWQDDEDVIEETIICEEMEVDGDEMETTRYTIAEDGSVVLEEVLLMNDTNFEGKEVVQFTVIQNEDGTESMVMASNDDDNHYEASSKYTIEEDVNCDNENKISVNKDCKITEEMNDNTEVIDVKVNKKSSANTRRKSHSLNNIKETRRSGKSSERQSENILDCARIIKESIITDPTSSPGLKNEENGSSIDSPILTIERRKKSRATKEKTKKSISPCDLERDLATITIQEPSKIETHSSENSNNTAFDATLININTSLPRETMSTSELLLSIQNDDNSTSTLDKVDQITSDSIVVTSIPPSDYQRNLNRTPTPNTDTIKLKKIFDQPQNVEELLRESGLEVKTDLEDVKLCSSSENSNDTSLSLNCIKMPDFNEKISSTIQVEGEKKIGFRSRSGSTDTTGSESGSNSSGVRRSNRIRSQGLMKPRSRGRGLVTKPTIEVTKILQQDREKLQPINAPVIQALRETPDSQSETQSDKENSNKASHSESNTPLTSGTIMSYDSDSTKPVKVKSRWRRSSELEMGGSTVPRLAFGSLGITSVGPAITPSSSELTSNYLPTVPENVASGVSTLSVIRGNESAKDSTTNSSSNSHSNSPVPTAIGVRMALPMVTQEKDREMEERLSQFEHIQENLYLTERYTNKETKRMVCDCFLTDEEIERGELGCGEDCLNRLLMIECSSRCNINDHCTNKRFQNCSYAKCEVFRTEKKGFGLRATTDLDIGEFIMEYVGEVLDPKDFRRRAKEYSKDKNKHYYFMALKSDQIIDATLKGNISRFINHSCDPNAETQKWTVNGELRIGFFNRRFISAGEEITFDYHFQRYGKEAQRCYCESANCRGWIGDTPEEEQEKSEKQEKRERERERERERDRSDVKKKREVKKPYTEDEDLEEEIDKLCSGGLKNRAHTLTLSRLMVRSREIEHRSRLLRFIQSGEQPCRRLFLDYHGLRLIWSYMMDVASIDTEEAQLFRLELLKTLITLPIPNKTMLMDSKVYSVVERWSNESFPSPKSESPVEDAITEKKDEINIDEIESNCDSNDKSSVEQNQTINDKGDENIPIEDTTNSIGSENIRQILELANNLLNDWSNLKEVFRIPKKERIEQMKEHEREADSGYREDTIKDDRRETLSSTYERYRSGADRYSRRDETGRERGDRRRGRESPDTLDSTQHRLKDKRLNDERTNLVPVPRLTKFERRQLFALKVAKEEEERLRRQQQEMWQAHESRCLALGIDPHTTSSLDPQTGYPLFFNPTLGQWQSYPLQDSGGDVYLGGGQSIPGISNQNPHQLPTNIPSEISPVIPQPGVYGMTQPGVPYSTMTHQPPPPTPQQFVDNHVQLQNNLVPVHNNSAPPITSIGGQHVYVEKNAEQQFPAATPMETTDEKIESDQQLEIPLIDLPPKWKCAKDARGRYYYYHIKERISQWLPPPPIHIGTQADSSSSSETSDDSSSSDEDVEETEVVEAEEEKSVIDDTDPLGLNVLEQIKTSMRQDPRTIPPISVPEPKKRRDGLVQERIISPRREERGNHKKYKDIKEKLRRQKEKAKMKEQMEKLRKHRRANKAKSHARHTANKLQAIAQSNELTAERKIKDTFRINMADVIVRFLNPYRQSDCKQGRITNTEDFKYLARKLTHFVMAKELKHCKSVDELQCNENVKHKAKDFVRKYMGKFGPVYQRSSDED